MKFASASVFCLLLGSIPAALLGDHTYRPLG
jgi:hypothetical protein